MSCFLTIRNISLKLMRKPKEVNIICIFFMSFNQVNCQIAVMLCECQISLVTFCHIIVYIGGL
jgi:hypothetical protein